MKDNQLPIEAWWQWRSHGWEGGGGLMGLEHPLSKKKRLGIFKKEMYLLIYKNSYLHPSICLGFLNKSNYFINN